MYNRISVGFACVLASTGTMAQTPQQIDAVAAVLRSSYVITNAVNACPVTNKALLGWAENMLRYCEYKEGGLSGAVYLLDVKPNKIASWIRTSCQKFMKSDKDCFRVTLACAKWNSGLIFPVSGNVIENSKNYFFRHGMTANIDKQGNATAAAIDMDLQRKQAVAPDDRITRIKTGLTRYWRTLPSHYFDRNGIAPFDVCVVDGRRRWLNIAHSELRHAMNAPQNRLLEAWMHARKDELAKLSGKAAIGEDDCPKETASEEAMQCPVD